MTDLPQWLVQCLSHHSKWLCTRNVQAYLGAVWHIVNWLFCVLITFFLATWPMTHLCSSVPPYCASWNSHTIYLQDNPVFQLKLLGDFSLHPSQFSWQLWLKSLLVYLTVAWYQQKALFSTSLSSLNTTDWYFLIFGYLLSQYQAQVVQGSQETHGLFIHCSY